MKRLLGLLIVLALAATPAMAQKINIDFAHDYNFETIKTFQYAETKDTNASNPLMAQRIVDRIKSELTEGGLTEVSENPDIYVTYHLSSEDNTVYNTTSMGYGGYHRGFYRWGGGMGSSQTTTTTYTKGTLVVDAYDSTEKKMIWRGTGTVTVKKKPEQQNKQIDNIFKKMGQKWDKILKNQGK
jgi:hypothetical protein